MSFMGPQPDPEGDRATSVLFRMSHADKAGLVRDSKALGISVQALMERRVLGRTDATTRQPGRTPRREEELPMTG